MIPTRAGVPTPVVEDNRTVALVDNLRAETRLLASLTGVLEDQRTGVAQDDLGAVNDSVHGAHRILLTLKEARRERRSLLELLIGNPDVTLNEMGEAFGTQMTPELQLAGADLQAAAGRLAEQVKLSRQVLHGAIRAGDEFIRSLYGVSTRKPIYEPSVTADDGTVGSGLLINRQI